MKHDYSALFALTFAGRLHSVLSGAKRIYGPVGARKGQIAVYKVIGHLPLRQHGENGHRTQEIEIEVADNWLLHPPKVWTNAYFLRRHIDWHIFSDGSLCFVLAREWSDELGQVAGPEFNVDAALVFATTWLNRSVDSLLCRHLIGHRLKLPQWIWPDWPHGSESDAQYEKERAA